VTSYHKSELYHMNKQFVRMGRSTNQISFPLGGIGTGSVGLAGNGRLVDWEIFNRPNKNSHNGFSFFALRAESGGQMRVAKVLQGDLHPPFTGTGTANFHGFGFGPDRETLAGLPHFRETRFTGEFPCANVEFLDEELPLTVHLTAWSPFIPLNDFDSSLPVAMFEYTVKNTSAEVLDVSVVGNLTNPAQRGAVNEYVDGGRFKLMRLHTDGVDESAPEFGEVTLSTDGDEVDRQSYWFRGGWFDSLTVFWNDFSRPGPFRERLYGVPREASPGYHSTHPLDVALLSQNQTLAPGETGVFRFLITWHYPNCVNYWNPGAERQDDPVRFPRWTNYYATVFDHGVASATYAWEHWERLRASTMRFQEILFASTLPDVVIDAISSTLSVFRSPTMLRLTDGTLYGFEGVHTHEGSCEGSCTHVWNYEQATALLFPKLARSMREIDYAYAQHESGKMAFRLFLPPERTVAENHHRAAADGQMGGIIKVYREWKISGDTEWLRRIWPKVVKSLEYAWDPANEDGWDSDRDGVLEGRQHHTLDMELFGPNSWLTGYYLAALRAASEMAATLGETERSHEYAVLFARGSAWVNQNLFNGEYFHQKVDLRERSLPEQFGAQDVYWNDEAGEMKYQIGEGCEIDQVIGQWYAHVVGLGYILDQEKVRTALHSLFRYNFVESFREFANTCRIYAVNGDKGLVIATWPKGNEPVIPIPYQGETQNGYEYQAACHMIYEGLIEEGLSVVKAIRDRYDGEKNNPWNEFECGSNYVRSMASYALLSAFSGFEYDMVKRHVGFSPRINQEHFSCFFCLHESWGEFAHTDDVLRLTVTYGRLSIVSFRSDLLAGRSVVSVRVGGWTVDFAREGDCIVFEEIAMLDEATALEVVHSAI